MITRMEMTYRSKEKCSTKPQIFSTGGYEVVKDGIKISFDFEEMMAECRFEDGYLFIDVLQKNLDETVLGGASLEVANKILRTVTKEDFTEIYHECFADLGETTGIELIPMEICFYDFSLDGDGKPIEVLGSSFCSLV